MAVYLDFEEPIKVLEDQLIENTKLHEEKGVDTSKIVKEIEKKLKETRKEIYSGLSAWQRVQVSRHPERPELHQKSIHGAPLAVREDPKRPNRAEGCPRERQGHPILSKVDECTFC